MAWKTVIVGPTDAAPDSVAFDLLYSFPTEEEPETHAEPLAGGAPFEAVLILWVVAPSRFSKGRRV